MRKLRVYISGPLTTQGDRNENMNRAIDAAELIAKAGHAPMVPHFTHIWDKRHPHPWEFWMQLDLAWIQPGVIDVVFRLHGESEGADIECERAALHQIPVVTTLDQLNEVREQLETAAA